MIDYGLCHFRRDSADVQVGIVSHDEIFPVSDVGGWQLRTLADLYDRWTELAPMLATLKCSGGVPINDVQLLPPSLSPSGIYCAGANYQDHVDAVYRRQNMPPEASMLELGVPPWHFIKAQNTLRGHGSEVALFTKSIDWEVELAAIIGKTARNVALENALEYVAGYTVANDLSARDLGTRELMNIGSPFRYDWVAQKSWEGSCPLGPWLVPATALGDPQSLALGTTVNGRARQDSNTSKMIYSVAAQIAHLSTVITLSPGDVILTGTPAGTGFESDEYLQPGDIVTTWVAGIGELTVTVR